MPRSRLFGRRIHISGSISKDPNIATPADVAAARELVADLVDHLMRLGANFVVPVDAENLRADDHPICFDWLVWETINKVIMHRPANVPGTLAIAVQHHKSEDQVPSEHVDLWDSLRSSPQIKIENAAQWNMNSKRMEAQAQYGDILITLGGTEGVSYLANLYHAAGKPVVPLDLPITNENEGSRKLFSFGMASRNSNKLFEIAEGGDSHNWLNKIRFVARHTVQERVKTIVELLETLERPTAFVVRLLNKEHKDFDAVQNFFDNVVQPVMEGELGYRLVVIDGTQAYEHARMDQEIFAKLHRASAVIADITGERPNCFLELGYAYGRALPTIVTALSGSPTPFDITTIAGLRWSTDGTAADRRREFRQHWDVARERPPLVISEGLVA